MLETKLAKMPTLDELLDSGVEHVHHILLKRREKGIAPFYTLLSEEEGRGVVTILPVFFRNDLEKDMAVAVVKATAQLQNAVLALYISEAWMMVLKHLGTPWHAKRALEHAPRPSESPDRVEVVQIIATDGTNTRACSLQMVRDRPGGKLISLVPMANDENTQYTGRMIDGIIPPRKDAK